MNEPLYKYDEESDTLAIVLFPAEKTTGIELTDHIILHINKANHRIARITLLDYSLLVQQTEYGPRTFPLTGFADLADDMRELVLELLHTAPGRDILHLAAYTPEHGPIAPVVRVQPVMATSAAQ